MTNEHTYVKIVKDSDNLYYKITITKTGTGIFGSKEEVQEIPFVFRSAELAKDFVTMLPDVIEKVTTNAYRCNVCHLCKASYETYKLTVGEYEVYIRWQGTRRNEGGFLSDKRTLVPIANVVKSFVTNIRPSDYRGYDVTYDGYEYEKLTDLINKLRKDKSDLESQKEEYNFELVQQ